MTWKKLTNLIGSAGDREERGRQSEIRNVFYDFHSRVQASLGVGLPPPLADRIDRLIGAVPGISKKAIVATGVLMILEMYEGSPEKFSQIVKARASQTKGRVALCVSIPLELHERLAKFISTVGNISQRDVAVAGIDLALSKCEALNGGPFPALPSIHGAK